MLHGPLHEGQGHTRDRVTRCADGAGAASRSRGPLVLEQLARSHSQRATQALDRIGSRSEEHTSVLQSQTKLVCRLLLVKKKDHYHPEDTTHFDSEQLLDKY